MKKSLVSLFLITSLALGGTAVAQDRGREGRGRDGHVGRGHGRGGVGHGPFSPEGMERHLTRLTSRLSLDEHQVTLTREILVSARPEIDRIRAMEPSPERREQIRTLVDGVATRIDAILSETQRAEFATMRERMRERMDSRGHGEHGPFSAEGMERRLTRLTERLSLDASQVTAVRGLMTAARPEIEAARALSPGPARRERMQAVLEGVATRIDAILNETQRAEFATMRARLHERLEEGRGHGRGRDRGGRGRGAEDRGI